MKFSILIMLAIALQTSPVIACDGLHFEIGAGKNITLFSDTLQWEDRGGIAARLAIRYEWENSVIQYEHVSQWDVGPPFDDRSESSLDSFTWNLRF